MRVGQVVGLLVAGVIILVGSAFVGWFGLQQKTIEDSLVKIDSKVVGFTYVEQDKQFLITPQVEYVVGGNIYRTDAPPFEADVVPYKQTGEYQLPVFYNPASPGVLFNGSVKFSYILFYIFFAGCVLAFVLAVIGFIHGIRKFFPEIITV